jgi:hypothetical protein
VSDRSGISASTVLYTSEDFSALEKKTRDMFSEGNAHPVGCISPLQIVMAVWPASNLKSALLLCRGHEGAEGSKGILRLVFQTQKTYDFLKSQCHHKIQEDSCKETHS